MFDEKYIDLHLPDDISTIDIYLTRESKKPGSEEYNRACLKFVQLAIVFEIISLSPDNLRDLANFIDDYADFLQEY